MSKSFSPKKIIVDGKEYSSLQALPDTIRKIFVDANKNGVPDILEAALGKQNNVTQLLSQENPTLFSVEDKTYHSFQDLPQGVQSMLQDKLGFSNASFAKAKHFWKNKNSNFPSGQFNTEQQDYTKFFIIGALLIGLFLLGGVAATAFYFGFIG